MKRNAITGEYSFTHDETLTIGLAIDARCEQCLSLYRSAPDCAARDYFVNEYRKACVLYKELYGTDYPVDIAEGPVPTPDSTSDTTNS